MSSFQLYVAIYFGLGLVVSLIVVAAHLANKRKESKFSRDIMKALNPKREAFLYRVLEDVIVPTLAFFLVGFFIWIAENIATFFGAWVYPYQAGQWAIVGPNKISSWMLLVIISFIIVAALKQVFPTRSAPISD